MKLERAFQARTEAKLEPGPATRSGALCLKFCRKLRRERSQASPPLCHGSFRRCGSRAYSRRHSRQASVLVGLLWCLALLSVLVIGVLHTTTVDLRIVKNYGDRIQAQYLALAGVEKAKALLYHDAATRRGSARNHTGDLSDAPREFKDVPFGRGQFRVFHQTGREDGGRIAYGVRDEESRLNVNHASNEELGKLYGMTPEIVAAIVDWRDEDDTPSSGGAEAEYYSSLRPPYLPRNGPFASTRELLSVRGIFPENLNGEDANQNGLLDPEEDDGNDSFPADNRDRILDAGWSELLTVHSSVQNVNASGQARVNVQSADESALAGVPGISTEIARAIVAYRGQHRLESLADLLEVAAVRQESATPPPGAGPRNPSGGPGGAPVTQAASAPGNPAPQATGPKLISEDLLLEIADDLTTLDGREQPGAINLNTASVSVLTCLAGLTPELAQAIVSYRQSSGYLPNVAWLLRVPGFNRQLFKQVAPRVTVRSETFQILSEGQVNSTGARKRLQVVVRVSATEVETLSYREDL